MGLKSLQEFAQDAVLRSLPLEHIWVLPGIVRALDIIHLDHAIAVFVDDLEGAFNKGSSAGAHWSSDFPEELIVGNGAVTVGVELGEEDGHILVADTNPEVSACL